MTNLLAIGHAALLEKLFGVVVVPAAVWSELRVEHEWLPDFLRLASVRDSLAVVSLAAEELDEGEAEAIVLAQELGADFLLMDESAGRTVATERGLRVIGLLGVLRRAKDSGLIPAVKPLLAALLDEAGFWVSAELVERVLRGAGEL